MAPTNHIKKLISAVGAVAFGNIISKVIMFFANVLIANRLLEAGFGQLSVAFSIVNYLSLVCFSGIDILTTRQASHSEKSELGMLSYQLFIIRRCLCLILIAVISVAAYFIGGQIGVLLFIYGLSFLPQIFYTVNLFYGVEWPIPVMVYFIGGRIVYLLLLVFGVKQSEDLLVVPIVFGISILVENLFLLNIWLRKYSPRKFKIKVDFNKWKDAIPLTSSSAFLLLHENAGLILTAIILGFSSAGIYSASYRLVYISISLTSLLSYIFLARLTRIKAQKNLGHFMVSSYATVGVIGLLMAIVGMFLAKFIVSKIYVEAYLASGPLLAIAVWQMAVAPLRIISYQTLNAFELQSKVLPYIIIGSVTSIIINFILINKIGINGAAIGTVIGELILTIMMISLVFFHLKTSK